MQRSHRWEAVALALIVAGAAAYVVPTYRVFAATADEPHHIAGGLDWLAGGHALWHDDGPPDVAAIAPPAIVARAAVAAGPYLAGVRAGPLRALLYQGPGYQANLVRARAGNLPFLLIAIVLTWALARRLFGAAAGVCAAAALACVPAVLGHAGLATTDVGFMAAFLLATLVLLRLLEMPSPSWPQVLGAGAAFGLALATKVTALALLPAIGLVVLHRWGSPRTDGGGAPRLPASGRLRTAAARLAAAGAVAGLVIWATYRFSFGSPSAVAGPNLSPLLIDGCFPPGARRRFVTWAFGLPLPAPQLFNGLLALCGHNAPGKSTSYLLGRISQEGFPHFFVVALAVKTPLALALLASGGLVAAIRSAPERRWRALAPALIAATMLVASLPAHINVGVRHVLYLYPLLAVYAGAGAVAAWNAAAHGPGRRRWAARGAAVALGIWLLATPARAAPDHLAWFNALPGRHPENVLLDSDLDWGQDLLRLEKALADRRVPELTLAIFTSSDLCRHALPRGRWLRPHERVTGWIAVSEMYRKGVVGFHYRNGDYCDSAQFVGEARPDPGQFAWLDAYAPVARIGRSILLYDIPARGAAR